MDTKKFFRKGEAFSRTMYCEHCARKNLPEHRSLFRVVGGKSKQAKIFCNGTKTLHKHKGFSPHVIKIIKNIDNEDFLIHTLCGIDGCGIKITKEKKDPVEENEEEKYIYRAKALHEWTLQEVSYKELLCIFLSKDEQYFLEPLPKFLW